MRDEAFQLELIHVLLPKDDRRELETDLGVSTVREASPEVVHKLIEKFSKRAILKELSELTVKSIVG